MEQTETVREMRVMGTRARLERILPPEVIERFEVKGGDTKLIYSADNEAEVESARRTFDELTKKGFRAFRVNRLGNKGEQMDSFDPEAGKVILVPQMQGG